MLLIYVFILFIVISGCTFSTYKKNKFGISHVIPAAGMLYQQQSHFSQVYCSTRLNHYIMCLTDSHFILYSNVLYRFVARE